MLKHQKNDFDQQMGCKTAVFKLKWSISWLVTKSHWFLFTKIVYHFDYTKKYILTLKLIIFSFVKYYQFVLFYLLCFI